MQTSLALVGIGKRGLLFWEEEAEADACGDGAEGAR